MFYLFLFVLSLVEFYFFRLLNNIILHHSNLSGDILFTGFCVFITVLILIGTIHIKHLNRNWLKKTSIGIIILSILYLLASIITFNFKYILSALEFSIIFIVVGIFLYLYESAPEGEPDAEDVESEDEREYLIDYLDSDLSYENYEEFDNFPEFQKEETFEDENLSNLNNIILEIKEKMDPEQFESNLSKTKKLIESIFNANSEYREENLDNIISILTIYNNELDNDSNLEKRKQVEDSIDLINSNLENLYYNTRGAQVFRTEQNVKALREELEGLS